MGAKPVNDILIVGGGTAGFLCALTLRRCLPDARIRVLYSEKLGVLGVGEGSLRQLPYFLHRYLGIDAKRFFDEVAPTWKLGVRFLWGRGDFNYSFSPQMDVTHPHPDLSHPVGYYCFEQMEDHCVASVLMRNDFTCLIDGNGVPTIGENAGYHLDNERFAAFLRREVTNRRIDLIDDRVVAIPIGPGGVEQLRLESGKNLSADLYVDCSGFHSLLLGQSLAEPFEDYRSSLYCDRVLIGSWRRSEEPLHPYTTAETMTAGWCWQIEHEDRINRGYVYSSDFISDEQAEAELRSQNPQIGQIRQLRFRSGRYRHCAVQNVVAIGNASGFVEPLEATAIGVICSAARALGESLADAAGQWSNSSRRQFNTYMGRSWDSVADFLAVHYRFNGLRDTAFWRECRNSVDLRGAEPIVDYYRENGPGSLWRLTLEDPVCRFRLDGYYTLLLGQQVPHARIGAPSAKERSTWRQLQQATRRYAANGLTTSQALALVKSPPWQWQPQHFAA